VTAASRGRKKRRKRILILHHKVVVNGGRLPLFALGDKAAVEK
jgi:hypothetical protein